MLLREQVQELEQEPVLVPELESEQELVLVPELESEQELVLVPELELELVPELGLEQVVPAQILAPARQLARPGEQLVRE
jgi:hypothetical protein